MEAIHGLHILDTATEPELDSITRAAARVARTPISLITIVDEERQWFKSHFGLDLRETPRAVSFCNHAIEHPEPLIVHDTALDERFVDNALVTGEPGIRFYAGFPVSVDGQRVGTLCVIDRVPRNLSERQTRLLAALASQVELQLQLRQHEVPLLGGPPIRQTTGEAPPSAGPPIEFRIQVRPELRLVHLGEGFEQLLGYPPEDFLGGLEAGGRLVHPDDRPLLRMALRAPTKFIQPLTLRWRTSGGGWVWLVHRFETVIEDGKLVALDGTADPVAVPVGAKRGPDSSPELISQALDAMAIVDPQGVILYQSPAVIEMFGYDPREHLGKSAFELVHPDDLPGLVQEFAGLAASPGTTNRQRYRYRHADGSYRTVESVARNLTADSAVGGILIQTRDMTAWVELEQSLADAHEEARQLATSRQQLIEELQRVRQAKEQLHALIVHDLKSPLTAVMMNASFILEDVKAAGLDVEPVRDVIHASERLHRMVMDILDVSRSESGRLLPRLAPVQITALIDRAEVGVGAALRARKLGLTREGALSPSDLSVSLDASLIDRVLQNLLDNACKYAPAGTAVVLRLANDERVLRLDVLDEGPGVPDALKDKVFELYAQAESDVLNRARSSRGLGLAFCKLAVEAHGGRIWVEDRPGGGSAFCVELPRR